MIFSDVSEVALVYESRQVELHATITVRIKEAEKRDGERVEKITRYETTVGRALLSEILPVGLSFTFITKAVEEEGDLAHDQRELPPLQPARGGFSPRSRRRRAMHRPPAVESRLPRTTCWSRPRSARSSRSREPARQAIEAQYTSGLVDEGERYNKARHWELG